MYHIYRYPRATRKDMSSIFPKASSKHLKTDQPSSPPRFNFFDKLREVEAHGVEKSSPASVSYKSIFARGITFPLESTACLSNLEGARKTRDWTRSNAQIRCPFSDPESCWWSICWTDRGRLDERRSWASDLPDVSNYWTDARAMRGRISSLRSPPLPPSSIARHHPCGSSCRRNQLAGYPSSCT